MKKRILGFLLAMTAIALMRGQSFALNGPVCSEVPQNLPAAVPTSGFCANAFSGDLKIPVANFSMDHTFPLVPIRVTQPYNNDVGHNGLDLGGDCSGAYEGKEKIRNVFKGTVILSLSEADNNNGWGEVICTASRANPYSEEIITYCSHHLHPNTRFVEACEIVSPGDLLGMEGNTGKSSGAHLHFTVRRWKNLEHLRQEIGYIQTSKGPAFTKTFNFFGNNGYGAQNGEHLHELLDPGGLLYHSYNDYVSDENGNEPAYMWSQEYVLKMRKYGIEFGLWNGNYGAQEPSTRGEVARWLKVALGIPSVKNVPDTFDDVSADDERFPYVEALTRFPISVSQTDNAVVNSLHSCTDDGTKKFCPDDPVNRAEALKMMVTAFYYSEFDSFNRKYFALKEAVDLLDTLADLLFVPKIQLFQDVDIHEWYAPYVYFGVWKGLVELQPNFNPTQQVMREEMAKWVVKGYELLNTPVSSLCDSVTCPSGEHCNPSNGNCDIDSKCIPSETKDCEVGGGLSDPCDTPQCAPNDTQTQDCGNGGEQVSTCTDECEWGPWGSCEGGGSCQPNAQQPCGNCGTMTCGSNGQWGSCLNQGVCNIGSTDSQTCNDVGTQTRTCLNNCTWSGWGTCSAECTPGQQPQTQSCTIGGQSGTQTRNCNLNGTWTSWGTCVSNCQCSSGICCDSCNYRPASYPCDSWTEYQCAGSSPGQDGQYQQVQKYCSGSSSSCSGQTIGNGWQTYQGANCSSSEVCVMSGGTPQCVSSCTDTYKASASVACWSQTNPQNVEICLHLNQKNGSLWEYQVCKQGGSFQNSYDYEVIDINNSSHYLHASTGSSGSSCSGWHNINMNYISSYGQSNGASLRGQLYSPSGCSQSGCFFRSSLITLWKECQ